MTRIHILCYVVMCSHVFGADWYVAPNAGGTGNGSKINPWPLQMALTSATEIKPGDTLYLQGGGYTGAFRSSLSGTVLNPITVRPYPGEHAVIIGTNIPAHVITISGSNTVWRNLEVFNSNPNRELERGHGFYILGAGTKVIHCVIHDTGNGIGAWTEAPDTEITGNVIYFNGYQGAAPDRGHGHGIYMQNLTGTKLVRNNIIFNQFGKGIQAYGKQGYIRHMTASNNIVFNNGGANRNREPEDNFLFGGNQSAIDITCVGNVSFTSMSGGVQNRFGYANGGPTNLNDGLLVANNYFARGGANYFLWWTNAIVTNNVFKNDQASLTYRTDGITTGTIDWNRNTYYGGGAWVVNQTNIYNFTQWKAATGFDANSTQASEAAAPASVVHVFADPYEAGRAQISVINWASNNVVAVDFSPVLSVGQAYTLKNAQDYYGAAVLSGTYAGGSVNVPMTNLTATLPLGVTNIPPTSWPVMNAFVLLKGLSPPSDLREIK